MRHPSLGRRLALLVAAALLFALVATLVLADGVFARLQHAELAALLERDLDRVEALLRTGALGEAFVADDAGPVRLQFVSNAGEVQLPEPGLAPLPLVASVAALRIDDRPWLVSAAPWVLPTGAEVGTIRMALDLREADSARARLRLSLAASGAAIAIVTIALTSVVLRRSLRPLVELADGARAVDPSAPGPTRYAGPDDEVAALARALDRAFDAIRAQQRAERDALAEVAHELAAPLTVVAGELRSLARRHGDDERVAAASAAANELLHTSRDLLTVARGEFEVALELAVVDVADLAAEVAAEYQGVRVWCDDSDQRVLAERDRLRQVLRNLIRNAIHACGRPDGVEVRVAADAARVRLEVVDDGPGIAAADVERVFERHVSGRSGGSGIGLAVVQRLVRAMGGEVRARSQPGDTRFTVELPSFAGQVDAGSP